jgi:diguanylate cyclase (GGDEF)-like protein
MSMNTACKVLCLARRPGRWQALALVLLAAWALAGPAAAQPAAAPPALRLHGNSPEGLDAWPFLEAWLDPGRLADIDEVQRQRAAFRPPAVPRNSYGPRQDALWLRLPLQVPDGDPLHWVLSVDYTELASIDYYLVGAGRVLDHQRLGQRVIFTQRALPSAGHAVRLKLEAGRDYEVFLRVRSVGELVVPLRLLREPQFHEREARLQLEMGLLLGVTLALLAYCMLYGLHLREPLFLIYAAQLVTLSGYLSATRGVLGQYLWPDDLWWTINGPPLLLALALSAACAFIDRVLNVAALQRWCSHVLRTVAGIGLLLALLLRLGLIDLTMLNDAFTLVGTTPVVLGGYCAWLRWRQGDRVAGWIVVERIAQTTGVLVMTGVVQGVLPADAMTLDCFLWTSMLEMGIWVWALGTRARVLLDAEQMARADQTRLQAIAHTDVLTGLLNRHGMQEALVHAIAAATPARQLAVYVLDLDGFKAVNDTHGHAAGDMLLAAVAQRLRGCLRAADIVARQGGDEFVVAAVGLPHAAAATSIGRVLQQQFDAPFMLPQAQCRLGVTIGYALAPEDGADVDSLLAAADQAMYAGKRGGDPRGPLECTQRLRRGRAVVPASMPAPLRE